MGNQRLTRFTPLRNYFVFSPVFFLLLALVALATACGGDAPKATPVSVTAATSSPPPTVTATASPISEPSATRTPQPTATFTPVPTTDPTNISSTPSSESLAEAALGYLNRLLDDLGPRESATQEEMEAAEYLASQFESFGYDARLQPFIVESLSEELSTLVLNVQDGEEVDVIPLLRSATGEVSGNLVSVGLATKDDIPEGGLEGMVALVERGIITFEEKTNRVEQAGAVAIVIYNNRPGDFQGILLSPAGIPALGITEADGERIEDLLSDEDLEVRVSVETEEHDSRNVIADKPGPGNGMLVLGGHYDTIPDISGASDNSSGTALLLTLAEKLAQESLPFSIRFIAFGSEELGLLGSRHYVNSLSEAEEKNIQAMFNFDAVGTGNFGLLGNKELTTLAEELAESLQIDATVSPGLQGGDSDHSSFAAAGIPVLMFFGDDFSRIHTPADTLDFVEPRILGDAAELALALLQSPDLQAILK